MGNFQKNVLMIACIVFILMMILVAILMKNETNTQDFTLFTSLNYPLY